MYLFKTKQRKERGKKREKRKSPQWKKKLLIKFLPDPSTVLVKVYSVFKIGKP